MSHGNSTEDDEFFHRWVSRLQLVRAGWLDECSQDDCQGHVPVLDETGRSQTGFKMCRWSPSGLSLSACGEDLAGYGMGGSLIVPVGRKGPVQIFHARTRTAWRRTMSATPVHRQRLL